MLQCWKNVHDGNLDMIHHFPHARWMKHKSVRRNTHPVLKSLWLVHMISSTFIHLNIIAHQTNLPSWFPALAGLVLWTPAAWPPCAGNFPRKVWCSESDRPSAAGPEPPWQSPHTWDHVMMQCSVKQVLPEFRSIQCKFLALGQIWQFKVVF